MSNKKHYLERYFISRLFRPVNAPAGFIFAGALIAVKTYTQGRMHNGALTLEKDEDWVKRLTSYAVGSVRA